jgi:hypothetical protein
VVLRTSFQTAEEHPRQPPIAKDPPAIAEGNRS